MSLPETLILRGGKPLIGTITLHGAKNALPKEMVAALLTSEICHLQNVAEVRDVEIVAEMLRGMGGEVTENGTTISISTADIRTLTAEELDTYAGKSRIPILLCGPILHRLGKVVIPQLGGCNIGSRPVDFHLMALQKMGAVLTEDPNYITMTADRLHGAVIHLDYPSVGATEQVLLSAVLADGVTTLINAAVEPEILDLVAVLVQMGSQITLASDRTITITGVKTLHGYTHFCLPDRIEAASWACAAVATNGKITVRNARQTDLLAFLSAFEQMGGGFEVTDDGMTFYRKTDQLRPVSVETNVHPGFMTDWQQPFVVALTQATGVSTVHETVYEDRFGYTEALNDMGADITISSTCPEGKECRFGQRQYQHVATITGPTPLHGAEVTIPDLRAGFSYVIAALSAEGSSTLHNVGIIARGYEHFLQKLTDIGAQVTAGD